MATRKNATKVSKKAEINIPAIQNSKKSKSSSKKALNTLKNTTSKSLMAGVLCLVLGICIGAGVWFGICSKDKFDLVGQEEITLTLDQTYADQGVEIIAFGKNDSQNIKIQTNLQQNQNGEFYAAEVGTYYIKYTTENLKYGKIFKIQKVRLVTFVEISEGGE